MKFTEQDYDYLSGKSFSNGYHLKLEENPICSRTSKIVELVKGSSCIHIGCCDHIPLIEKKIQERTWLHGLLERNCTDVLGIDINQEAVDYVNQHGFSAKPVYCANITAPDFAQSIPVGLEKFQFILLGEIIEHVDNPTAFLQDARKNLEEQGFYGTYIITVPNAFCMMRGGVYANGIENVNSDHRYWFTPYTIAKVMISAGVLPEELWFVNYADYPIEKSYQSDQMIIVGRGIRAKAQVDRSTVEDSVHLIEELLHHSDISGALNYIEALSPEERQQWEIQNLTGIVCSLCGQPKEARTFFEAALKQRPDDPEVLYNLADTYAALGRTRQAKQMLERCEHTENSEELKQDIAALRQHLTEQKGGRVLMVAYYFPPLSGSGVFRSIKFAKYLPMFGWEPTVISTDRPPNGWDYSDSSQLKEIPEGMEVIRVPDGISTKRETSMGGERAQAIMNFLHSVLRFSPEADRIFSKVSQSHDGIVQLLTFPCVALSWAYDVVQYIEKNLDLNEFQAVYTTSGPESAHLIGFYLKQKYGIPWVADYRDTWTFNPYGVDYNPDNAKQRLRFELESVLLHSADCNLTIEDSLVDDYERHFGLDKGKVVSITNGYDEQDFISLKQSKERMDKFTINYSGLLYLEERSIVPVLIAIQQLGNEGKIDLSKLRFRIVGQPDEENMKEVQRYGLEQIIDQTGYLFHSQALQANVDANLLLLLVGDEPKFKPVYTGKFFEYLRSGRPILALAPKGGAVDRVLREGGHGEAMLSTQISKIKSMILREYKKWERGESAEPLHSPVIERFERKVLTQQLAEVLNGAVMNSIPLAGTASGDLTSQITKYLVICNGGYPAEGNPRCMFAHERVLQYIKAGLNVDAFGFIWDAPLTQYEYQGVQVTQGGAAVLKKVLQENQYEKLLIHFVDAGVMYAIQQAGKLNMPMIVWCHGYEVLPWYRCWFNYAPQVIEANKVALRNQDSEKRSFLRNIYDRDNIQFVFVSEWQMDRSKKYVGVLPKYHQVIHNFINYEYFASSPKRPEDRLHILSIKNHATRMYANDLTAKAIIDLSERSWFNQVTFELYGKGVLFDENYGELIKRNYPNVKVHKEFVSHDKMKDLFHKNGIFLSPTRMDSHQITTSEAMSAGMAVITSSAGPIREFMDESCGSLFEFDNYWMMAEDIEYLYFHPEEFLRKSQNAVKRIRTQCSYDNTIGRELKLILE